jgi:hypothetical protein
MIEEIWIREEAGQVTNHKTLFDQIDRWRHDDQPVYSVTLNYDRFIENALFGCGIQLSKNCDYIRSDRFKLAKFEPLNYTRRPTSPLLSLRSRRTGIPRHDCRGTAPGGESIS